MNVTMFTSWQVACGIADYSQRLTAALRGLPDTVVDIVPFDRQAHPRADYVRWGQALNTGDLAHIQHEYTFFGYLLPWRNYFRPLVEQVRRPLVITRHVSFDGPLPLVGHGPAHWVRQLKWALYNRWLGPYATYLNRDTFDRADDVIVLSQHMKDQLVARGLRPEKIAVIPPGVPDVRPAAGVPSGATLRQHWGWDGPGQRVVGQFGFITPAKGHVLAVEALARLGPDYCLLIAGGVRRPADQPALEAALRRAADLGVAGRVRVTGYLDEAEVPAHLAACDVLVFPYTRVDTSYSVVTALAYGAAPVIASDVAAHRELAEQSGAVALFASGDAAALAGRVRDVLADGALRARLLAASRNYARQNRWAEVAARTRAVYAQAFDRARARAGRA